MCDRQAQRDQDGHQVEALGQHDHSGPRRPALVERPRGLPSASEGQARALGLTTADYTFILPLKM